MIIFSLTFSGIQLAVIRPRKWTFLFFKKRRTTEKWFFLLCNKNDLITDLSIEHIPGRAGLDAPPAQPSSVPSDAVLSNNWPQILRLRIPIDQLQPFK